MKKPTDYDQTRAHADYTPLPPDGYVCVIKSVEEVQSSTGREMLKITLDIHEGEYKEYYISAYTRRSDINKKWGCYRYLLIYTQDGKTDSRFKRFIECVERSNAGFTPMWGERFGQSFQGKLIGCVFRREEFNGNDGQAHWSIKPYSFYTVDDIRNGDFAIPKDKQLQKPEQSSWQPTPSQNWQSAPPQDQQMSMRTSNVPVGFDTVDDDDLPF